MSVFKEQDVISILDWSDEDMSHHYYKQANEWKVEMEYYEDGSEDLDAYYYQNIESDAESMQKKMQNILWNLWRNHDIVPMYLN